VLLATTPLYALVRMQDGEGRKAAVEILLNTPTIAERIFKGEFHELKTIMGRSRELGMRTFDWALFELYNEGHISYEEAIRNADSANELRLNIKLRSPRAEPATSSGLTLSIDAEPTEEERLQEMQRQQVRRRQVEQERLVKLDAERKQKREQEERQLEALRQKKQQLEAVGK
jgi:twitching motility protein PilU